jgi:hypothetical protein
MDAVENMMFWKGWERERMGSDSYPVERLWPVMRMCSMSEGVRGTAGVEVGDS